MAPDSSAADVVPRSAAAGAQPELRLSRWINEPLPDLRAILTGRDVSRLTRRPHWLLCGLAWFGRFPRRRVYRGRALGWHRAEILEWLSRGLAIEPQDAPAQRRCIRRQPRQACLPLECRAPCTARSRAHDACPTSATPPRRSRHQGMRSQPALRERHL
jgi:hypothetical protein